MTTLVPLYVSTQRGTTNKFSVPIKLFRTFPNGLAKGILHISYILSRCKRIKYSPLSTLLLLLLLLLLF